MGLGSLILGLASLAVGINQVGKGLSHLSGHKPTQTYAKPRRALPAPSTSSKKPSKKAAGKAGQAGARRRGMGEMTTSLHNVRTLDERLGHIKERIHKGKADPQIYALARNIVAQKCGDKWCVPEKDNLAEVKAIFTHLRKNVRYTSDPVGLDAYAAAKHTLAMKAGDCDDYSITGGALLSSIGIPTRLKVIQTVGSPEPNHIWVEAGLPRANPTKWYALDASVDKPFGWQAPKGMVAKTWVYPV